MISCGIDGKELSPEEKYTVDTIYSRQAGGWRQKADSICNASKDSIFAIMVDSLRTERMEEIDMLLMKRHQK
jgi:hypothetical protein